MSDAETELGADGRATDDLIAMFEREARAVGAGVVRVAAGEVAAAVAGLLAGARPVVVAAGLGDLVAELRRRGLNVVSEEEGDAALAALPAAEGGLGVALLGVVAGGSVLIGPGTGGEGLISILPPHFVVLLPVARVVCDLREALARVAPLVAEGGARLAFVTGPSRTADIELTSVIGVHGPLRLDVVLVDE